MRRERYDLSFLLRKEEDIMVTMKNIKRTGDTIYLDCFKENKEENHFSLVLDAVSCDIISSSLTSYSIYAKQAALKIKKILAANEELPTETSSWWC